LDCSGLHHRISAVSRSAFWIELSDRRVFYVPFIQEDEKHCIDSALDSRRGSSAIIDDAPKSTHVHALAKEIQRACRKFISDTQQLDFRSRDHVTAIATRSIFESIVESGLASQR